MSRRTILYLAIVITLLAAGIAAYYLFFDPYPPPSSTITTGNGQAVQDFEATAAAAPVSSSAKTYVIVPAESEVRFIVDEILNNSPNTVVGRTSAVEGAIAVDYANPSGVSMSAIRVDIGTLATDNSMRNRTMHQTILETGNAANRIATFTPTGFSGLPASVTIGEPFSFQIAGDLTIHGVTRSVTFDASVTAVSDTRLEGLARLGVLYSDFGIQIIRLPMQVAGVDEDVILEIEFVAEAH